MEPGLQFAFWPALVAGAAGGLVMTVLMTMMRKAGVTRMDMELVQGSMVTGDRGRAKAIGLVTHVVMMSGLVLGSLYALVFTLVGTAPGDAWWFGAVLGLVHGIVAGFVIAMVPTVHPRMNDTVTGADHAGGEVRLDPPGLFGKNYGAMTPPGVVMGHVAYGLVVGLVYAWLV